MWWLFVRSTAFYGFNITARPQWLKLIFGAISNQPVDIACTEGQVFKSRDRPSTAHLTQRLKRTYALWISNTTVMCYGSRRCYGSIKLQPLSYHAWNWNIPGLSGSLPAIKWTDTLSTALVSKVKKNLDKWRLLFLDRTNLKYLLYYMRYWVICLVGNISFLPLPLLFPHQTQWCIGSRVPPATPLPSSSPLFGRWRWQWWWWQ